MADTAPHSRGEKCRDCSYPVKFIRQASNKISVNLLGSDCCVVAQRLRQSATTALTRCQLSTLTQPLGGWRRGSLHRSEQCNALQPARLEGISVEALPPQETPSAVRLLAALTLPSVLQGLVVGQTLINITHCTTGKGEAGAAVPPAISPLQSTTNIST